MLRDEDRAFFQRKGWTWDATSVVVRPGYTETHVVVHDFRFPDKYRPTAADMLVCLPPGYPEVGPDMFWTRPDVVVAATGALPDRADVHAVFGDLQWQRWSRHFGAWRPDIDNTETYFAAINKELNK